MGQVREAGGVLALDRGRAGVGQVREAGGVLAWDRGRAGVGQGAVCV